ncbi:MULTISPECIES: GNAT family N-acetyltransferase [Leuconostoc]|jgi:ribosomal protein S18 acetylase RimI-like enzyme|uniref:GNAT family N-acetyltransferase n=2 Tax=Lactobacillaceae TaxID=33958 RepID=UPI001F349BB7|nr:MULTISPECIES: GNAT family N-acetyltransferase [Leuconostoc]
MKKSFARYSHYNMNTEQMFAQATGYYNYDKIEMTHEFYQKDNDMTLTNFNITDETNWQNIYLNAFPAHERLPFKSLKQKVNDNNQIKMLTFKSDDRVAGILFLVTLADDKAFILYFAVDATIRGKGIGSQMLSFLKQQYTGGIILESEIIGTDADNEQQRLQRYHFYQRNGVLDSGFVAQNMGGTFHLLRTSEQITVADYLKAIDILGLTTTMQ